MIVFQRRVPPVVAGLIALTLVTSIAAAVDAGGGGELYYRLALEPAGVWRGELWRLATWTLVQGSPWALVFGCVTLFFFGGDLFSMWGRRRFLRFVVAIVLLAGAGTSLLALVFTDAWAYPHLAGWALGDALVIAWALQFPERQVRLYGLIAIGGTQLAYGTFAFAVLCAVFYGAGFFLPELIAGGASLLTMTGALRRLQRRYRKRDLHVVHGDQDGPRWN